MENDKTIIAEFDSSNEKVIPVSEFALHLSRELRQSIELNKTLCITNRGVITHRVVPAKPVNKTITANEADNMAILRPGSRML